MGRMPENYWTEDEVIVAYLLSRDPNNRIYQRDLQGDTIYRWGRTNYDNVADILDNLFHQAARGAVRRGSCVRWELSSKRVFTHELSQKIKAISRSQKAISA